MPVNPGLTVRGEVLVVRAPTIRGNGAGPSLPGLPGPSLLVAVHDEELGTGLFVARPARLGLRPVLQVTLAVVSRFGAGTRFGLSAEVGRLGWAVDGHERQVEWAERGLKITAHTGGKLAMPVAVRLLLARQRADGPVVVPVWIAGLARPAAGTVQVDDTAAARHRGVLLSGLRFAARPARRPGTSFNPIRSNGVTAEPAARTGQAALVARRPDPAYRSSSS